MKIIKFKRLKIAEQIIVVLLLAVLTPLITIGVIINNVSQQSVRKELKYSAQMITQFVGNSSAMYLERTSNMLRGVSLSLKHFYFITDKNEYLKDVLANSNEFKTLKLVDKNKILNAGQIYNPDTKTMRIQQEVDADTALIADIDMGNFGNKMFQMFQDDSRQIYVLDIDNSLIAAHNMNKKDLEVVLRELPQKLELKRPVIFGSIKNQPMAYFKIKNPDWTVVVNTTSKITKTTINKARFNIILSLLLAGLFIIFCVLLYTYYLYINIRQLFKGIIALTKGNYERRIRLLTSFFTPYEIVFLAQEFNRMAFEINKSYEELKEKNVELKRLDDFRSSLISAVSHEFRTPLTSIMGYASRLLRSDIKIDEPTKHKSLKIIKQQGERLSRMVEDLLVIPEIESFRLSLNLTSVNLYKVVESSTLFVEAPNHSFKVEIDEKINVDADHDRLLQVLINLLDNAIKYSPKDSIITLSAYSKGDKTVLKINNEAKIIEPELLEKLFEKFTRLDDQMTRTTRGVGLGLFIVKGLVSAMGASISIESNQSGFNVILELKNA